MLVSLFGCAKNAATDAFDGTTGRVGEEIRISYLYQPIIPEVLDQTMVVLVLGSQCVGEPRIEYEQGLTEGDMQRIIVLKCLTLGEASVTIYPEPRQDWEEAMTKQVRVK